ncbi:MAG: AbrB/MazE/SpoVT family DNA-binding domain-containing protein [Anaerolineae bacterium]|nr:AbrB/MazE/SpoVT family DNA-binding domain-containing protein [Anaerolineae bacterium]
MQARIQKWGNSLALRIPKPFAVEVGLAQDTLVEVTIVDGKLLLEPVVVPEYSLDDFLADITEENLHQEVETGPAVGNEVW